ncbi:MAG: hypothetical protein FJ030_04425 [Chloroflexi bacterium]|nr:hypothetical protein [Chloroflexota bacterium]
MALLSLTQLLALLALLFAAAAFALRWRWAAQRPLADDRAPMKGSPARGVLYAFTFGMAPWAKESTRRHMIAYLRGVGFHIGIFAGLAALLTSPWWPLVPDSARWLFAFVIGFGAWLGFVGEIMRQVEHNLRALSTPDDHASVLLVSVFLATASIALINVGWLPAMYLASALMLIYAPLGKIRHCVYFFFSRRFFGLFVGRRAVIHSEATR